MRKPGLIASDVDGTLIVTGEPPTPRTRAAVDRVLAAGIPFVLVTGRPPRWIPPVAKDLPGLSLAICANGGVCYDIAADRVRWALTFAPGQLRALADLVVRALPGARLAVERVGRSAFDGADGQFVREPEYRHAWEGGDEEQVTRDLLFDRPASKLLARDPELTSEAMVAAVTPLLAAGPDPGVTVTFSHPGGLLEIAPAGVTKADGLARVAVDLGVDRADVIAFGDMPNDVEMLRWAGHGVAMGNAHAAVLAAADEVTGTTTEDGVARVLERWFPDEGRAPVAGGRDSA